MGSSKKISKVRELETFLQELRGYQYYRVLQANAKATRTQIADAAELRAKLLRDVGRFRSLITELTGKERTIVTMLKSGRESSYDIWFTGLQLQFNLRAADALSYCIDVTNSVIDKLEADIEMGVRDERGNLIKQPLRIDTEPPKAFIAHKGETGALEKLKDFLDAIGVQYLIAEVEPSDGRSVEKQVTLTYKPSDFAIILATKGGVIDKKTGAEYMGMNVADELGRAREKFGNRVILLLEKGVQTHTNISEIVYERFTPQSMDKAFIKIAKELKNWGFLKAGTVEE